MGPIGSIGHNWWGRMPVLARPLPRQPRGQAPGVDEDIRSGGITWLPPEDLT